MGILLWSSLSKTFFNPRFGRWKWRSSRWWPITSWVAPTLFRRTQMCGWTCFTDPGPSAERHGSTQLRYSFSCSILRFSYGVESIPRFTVLSMGRAKPDRLAALPLADQGHHGRRHYIDDLSGDLGIFQGHPAASRRGNLMSYELITILMFALMIAYVGHRPASLCGHWLRRRAFCAPPLGRSGRLRPGFAAAMKLMNGIRCSRCRCSSSWVMCSLNRGSRTIFTACSTCGRRDGRRARHGHDRPHGAWCRQ